MYLGSSYANPLSTQWWHAEKKSMRWFDIYSDVSEGEATRLLESAGQSELRKMEPLAGGWANSTYLLTLDDDSQLVLKLCNNKTPIEVERIIRNTCWLADHGVPYTHTFVVERR